MNLVQSTFKGLGWVPSRIWVKPLLFNLILKLLVMDSRGQDLLYYLFQFFSNIYCLWELNPLARKGVIGSFSKFIRENNQVNFYRLGQVQQVRVSDFLLDLKWACQLTRKLVAGTVNFVVL